jgi:hypothetical protein
MAVSRRLYVFAHNDLRISIAVQTVAVIEMCDYLWAGAQVDDAVPCAREDREPVANIATARRAQSAKHTSMKQLTTISANEIKRSSKQSSRQTLIP